MQLTLDTGDFVSIIPEGDKLRVRLILGRDEEEVIEMRLIEPSGLYELIKQWKEVYIA